MRIDRRQFIKISLGTIGTAVAAEAAGLGAGLGAAEEKAAAVAIKTGRQVPSVCPYCSVGCGMIVHTLGGHVVNVEGDPDHPINEGSLCPKGSSVFQLRDNAARVTRPMYRAAGATEWQEVTWEWALDKIARNVKKSRDDSFRLINDKGLSVNRTEGIASVGSAALDNEECFLYQKFLRGLGLVYIEHQARI